MPSPQQNRILVYLAQLVFDVVALTSSTVAAGYVRFGTAGLIPDLTLLLTLVPLYVATSFSLRAHSYDVLVSLSSSVTKALASLTLALALQLLVLFAIKGSEDISRLMFFLNAGFCVVFLIAFRLPIFWLVRHVLVARFVRRVLILDGYRVQAPDSFEVIDAEAEGILPDIQNPYMLHNFSGMIAGADRVIVSCAPDRRSDWSLYLKGVGCRGELLVPELLGVVPLHGDHDLGTIGIVVSAGPLDLRNRVLKRMLDLALSVPVMILLTPLLLFVAIAIKLDSQGPILFRQRRMGRGNRLFDVYKFRSMHHNQSDPDGKQSTLRQDKRVTRVGRLIRAMSVDELPQLFNVIEGDMSLVGPRPHALGSRAGDQLFWHVDPEYWLRHAIKPGITGLAQVRGYRGATNHRDDLANRLRSDLEYVANWSILGDISILVRTATVILHSKAY
ncbi:sugar transferase [Sphingomonas qilianensis]|uniref:Sugar transferase n=1 Tax=Sphingomonas qilianensis TaxID=1736690 RepID=A0ABU9XP59_9SPHN